MSHRKHLHVLSELFAHPIARNIEWSELITALSSIGLLQSESNGNYEFSRNGYAIVFERSHSKTLEVQEVLKLRHFLRMSVHAKEEDPLLQNAEIVAIDHHEATVIHNPGSESELQEKFHADVSKSRILHKTKHRPSYNDENPTDVDGYFDAIIKSMMKSHSIVILSHGTGSSSAGEKLFKRIVEGYPKGVHKIIAVRKCDLEALTTPEVIELGVELLHGSPERIA